LQPRHGEDGIGGVAVAAFEMAAAEVIVGLHVTDHGVDGGAAPDFAFDNTDDAALLSGDEDAVRVRRLVAAISLVDIAALEARETLGGFHGGGDRVPVGGMAGQRLGMQHGPSAGSSGFVGDDGDLGAKTRAGLIIASADASTSGTWKE
jgi:hypothetical protein